MLDHPEVLPIDDIDPSFGPLLPIGREVESGAGPIDVLFISPNGFLTVVETKLWRNPEARRTVVGQIIDYASALSRWSYDHLDQVTREQRRVPLSELVRDSGAGRTPWDEAEWVDAAARALRLGRFLLLVVGDGIREEVERMVEYVQTSPQLQFTLALVELRLFRRPDRGERLVVPSVVTRTAEVTRAVVDIRVAPETSVEVEVAVPVDGSMGASARLDERQFFDALSTQVGAENAEFVREVLRELSEDSRLLVERKAASSIVKRRRLLAKAPHLTLLGFAVDGHLFVGWLGQQLPRNGLPRDLGYEFATRSATIVGTKVHPRNPDFWASTVSLDRVIPVWPQLRACLEEFVARLEPPGDADRTA